MKFNLFSLVNDKRQKKKGPNRVLSDLDYALFLSAFSAIFGILHYRMWHETLKVSVGGLVMTLLFCAFWIGMAFPAGGIAGKASGSRRSSSGALRCSAASPT